MKRKSVVAIVVCAVSALPTVYAQKVVVEGTKVIIDCSSMPADAVTNTPKARTTTGTNTTAAGTGLTDIASAASNEKVYRRFEVSKVDNSTNTTWKGAIDLCNGLTQDGTTGWRLPTQRELILISIFKPALEKQFGTFSANRYASATEYGSENNWYVVLDSGMSSNNYQKGYGVSVRCIREI